MRLSAIARAKTVVKIFFIVSPNDLMPELFSGRFNSRKIWPASACKLYACSTVVQIPSKKAIFYAKELTENLFVLPCLRVKEEILKYTETELRDIIDKGTQKNTIISMKTYLLSDYGELILKIISESILRKFTRLDLMEIMYSAAKELVINATKANVKRVLFRQLNLDIQNPEDYEKGIEVFKESLTEDKITTMKQDFKKYDLPVTATFYYNEDVINIKVKNNFPLIEEEEKRIRDKFRKATSFSSLIDFFMEYGDNTEGAGMGITMVGILLDQSGISKHCFSLYSSEKYGETIAKIEIPLHKDYISKREMFEIEMKDKSLGPDELRKNFKYNYKHYRRLAEMHQVIPPD